MNYEFLSNAYYYYHDKQLVTRVKFWIPKQMLDKDHLDSFLQALKEIYSLFLSIIKLRYEKTFCIEIW